MKAQRGFLLAKMNNITRFNSIRESFFHFSHRVGLIGLQVAGVKSAINKMRARSEVAKKGLFNILRVLRIETDKLPLTLSIHSSACSSSSK